MAELVDAQVSEACDSNVVEVRFFSSAPLNSLESLVWSLKQAPFALLAAIRETFEVRKEFIQAINTHQTAFGLELQDEVVERLADYYELVQEHNPLLHLVGPCSPEEFAIRHILESLTLLEHLPNGAKFADVGAGAGLPSIPCLLVLEDLKAVLIESKEKKTKFLDLAVETLDISDQTNVVNKQFSASVAERQVEFSRVIHCTESLNNGFHRVSDD